MGPSTSQYYLTYDKHVTNMSAHVTFGRRTTQTKQSNIKFHIQHIHRYISFHYMKDMLAIIDQHVATNKINYILTCLLCAVFLLILHKIMELTLGGHLEPGGSLKGAKVGKLPDFHLTSWQEPFIASRDCILRQLCRNTFFLLTI